MFLKVISFLVTCFALCAHAELTLKEYLEQPAHPIDAKIKVDETKKVTVLIKAKEGGELELTNTRGDNFKLTIPAEALLLDTEISLSEISTFENSVLNFSQTPSGVEISPDGLALFKVATLTITPKIKISPKELAAFTSNASGMDVHFANINSNGATGPIELSLLHFSNYSIYSSLTVRESIRSASMSLSKNRISNWIANQLQLKKNGENYDQEFFENSIKDWINSVLKPMINDIGSCAAGRATIVELYGSERQAELLGLDIKKHIDINFREVLFNKTYNYCYEETERACYQDHRPFDVLHAGLSAARQSMLMLDYLNPFAIKMLNLSEKCLNFEFEMYSKMTGGDSSSGVSVTAKAKFPFNYDSYGRPLKITGPIQVMDMQMFTEGSDTECSLTSLSAPPVDMTITHFGMADMRFDQTLWVNLANLIPPSQGNFLCIITDPDTGHKTPFPISMPPGGPTENSFWGGMLVATHHLGKARDYNMEKGQLEPRKWNVHYGDIFATKDYDQKVEEVTEKTNIIIYHRPKR